MPLPLIPIIGAIASTIARVAAPAVIRAVAPRVIAKPVLQAATKVVPKAAPKAVPKAVPAAPKIAPAPKPVASKPTPPSAAPAAKAPAPKPAAKATAAKPAPKPPSAPAAKAPAAKAPSAVKKVATVGAVGAVGSLSGDTRQQPPRASGGTSSSPPVSPPASSTPTPAPGSNSGGSNNNNNNQQIVNDEAQESVEEYPDIIWDPEVYPEPPGSGGIGGDYDNVASETTPPIKSAPIDTVLFNDDLVDPNIIADLLFEDIGGQEILTIARHDTVNGQNVTYQPIKNLSAIQQQYSAESLVKIKGTAKDIFGNFPIEIQSKIPNVGNGPGGSNVYLDESGNIILEFVNLENGQEVEVQITSSGTIDSIGE